MCDLGGVEESGSIRARDCFEEHAIGDAGDEVADVFVPGERRQGFAESTFGLVFGI